MDLNRLIAVLVALYPRAWREEYAAEFRALLEAEPPTPRAVVDVVLHALAARAAAHARLLRAVLALGTSIVVEIVAVRTGITENILWPPTSLVRAGALLLLLLPWVRPAADLYAVLARRRAVEPAP